MDRRITVRMLLQHTSGVFNFTGEYFEDGTVGYVPDVIHDRKFDGVAHTGGNSMINNQLF